MAAATITIPIRLCAVATAWCRWTSTCPAARHRRKRCSTAFFSCRRRSAAPARSSAERLMMSEALEDLAGHVAERLGAKIKGTTVAYGELTVDVDGADIVSVLTFLRDDVQCRFVSFIDISGADYPMREKRFDVVYHLLSPHQNLRIRVKV